METTSNGSQTPERVTLELPAAAGARSVAVAGDFNGWSLTTHEMRQRDDGSFAITLDLDPGRVYMYRYWVDGERWDNDWSADAYEPNEFGGDNSVLDLRPSSPRLQGKTPVESQPPPAEAVGEAGKKPSRRPAKRAAADTETTSTRGRGKPR